MFPFNDVILYLTRFEPLGFVWLINYTMQFLVNVRIPASLMYTSTPSSTTEYYEHSPYSLSGVPDYFGRIKISSGGDLSHYSSASLY